MLWWELFIYLYDAGYQEFVRVVVLGGGVLMWMKRRYVLFRLYANMCVFVESILVSSVAINMCMIQLDVY